MMRTEMLWMKKRISMQKRIRFLNYSNNIKNLLTK